jgi:hypothetical protein
LNHHHPQTQAHDSESQQQEVSRPPLRQVLVWRVLQAVVLLLPLRSLVRPPVLGVLLHHLHSLVSQALLLDSLDVVLPPHLAFRVLSPPPASLALLRSHLLASLLEALLPLASTLPADRRSIGWESQAI